MSRYDRAPAQRWTEEQLDTVSKRLEAQHTIKCERCGVDTPRRGPGWQRYCQPCSDAVSLDRRAKSSNANPRNPKPARRNPIGEQISLGNRAHILAPVVPVDLLWTVRVAVPFTYSASKNSIYALRTQGHVALRRTTNEWRDALTLSIKTALREQRIVQNKLWLDIFVEKSNHRGDAINVVDLVCDAVKVAIGLDDRWFCIRRVDWSIVKTNPRVLVGFGQDSLVDVQPCSSCGRLLELSAFHKNASTAMGVGRNCKECSKVNA